MDSLVHVHALGQRLFSIQIGWLEDVPAFFVSLLDHFYVEREKPVNVALLMWLDGLGYHWLKCIRFERTLPDRPMEGPLSFFRFNAEFRVDLAEFHDMSREENIQWGGDLREFLSA